MEDGPADVQILATCPDSWGSSDTLNLQPHPRIRYYIKSGLETSLLRLVLYNQRRRSSTNDAQTPHTGPPILWERLASETKAKMAEAGNVEFHHRHHHHHHHQQQDQDDNKEDREHQSASPGPGSAASDGEEVGAVSPSGERALLRKIDWHLLPAVGILYLLSFLDRSNVANARIEGLATDLGMSEYRFLLSASRHRARGGGALLTQGCSREPVSHGVDALFHRICLV